MQRLLNMVSEGARLLSVGLLLLLVIAMAVQVGGRHLFLRGIPFTDEIAQISLTWMVFLAAPWVYRMNQHITVQIPLIDPNSGGGRALQVAVHALVIYLMVEVVRIGMGMAPMMSRIFPGSLPISRFQMHFLPLMIGAGLIVIFAAEAIVRIVTGAPRAED